MANLDKSNVVNGNLISASDISALYDAFTGTTTYDNIDFTGTASNSTRVFNTGLNTNEDYAVSFINSSSVYSQHLYDNGNGLLYNPSTNTLTTTNFEGTGSYITGSNIDGPVSIAQNLDSFAINDSAGSPGILGNPRPIAATVNFPSGGSGSIDLVTLGIASSANTLGSNIFINGQSLSSPTQINTADTLEINYTSPTVLSVTSSNVNARGAILIGWTIA